VKAYRRGWACSHGEIRRRICL